MIKKYFVTLKYSLGLLFLLFLVAQSANAQNQTDYIWIVFNFDFTCPDKSPRNPREAIYQLKWGKSVYSSIQKCANARRHPLYYARGFVLRIYIRQSKLPVSELKIATSNCKASQIYYREPSEWNNEKYRRITSNFRGT